MKSKYLLCDLLEQLDYKLTLMRYFTMFLSDSLLGPRRLMLKDAIFMVLTFRRPEKQLNPFMHRGNYNGQLFKKHFSCICLGFDGIVAHQLLQWILVLHPIHCHQVASHFFSLQTKMADGYSEMPSCSGIFIHSFYLMRLLQVKKVT